MANHLLVITADAVEGANADLIDWYQNDHLADMTALAGVEAAQLYELEPYLTGEGEVSPKRFLAIYEIPEERIEQARAALLLAREDRQPAVDAGRRPILPGTSYMAPGNTSSWFRPVTDRVENPTVD
jgi:hypothetical protein